MATATLTKAQLEAKAELERFHDQNTGTYAMWSAVNRDASGRLMSEKAGNQLITHREFDPYNGELMHLRTGTGIGLDKNSPLRHLSYTYDAHSNVTQRQDLANGLTETYQYDAFDRLAQTQSQHASYQKTRTYGYDLQGNMVTKSDTGSMDYNSRNQLTQLTLNNGTNSQYGYDANGNQTHGNGRSMTWNSFNKLSRLSQNGHTTEFWYGANRQRLKQHATRRDGSVHTSYYLNPVYRSNRLQDKEGNITLQTQHFIHADGKAVAILVRSLHNGQKNSDQFRYLHQDALDSIDTITDANGLPVEKLSYGAFGERRKVTGAPLETPTRNPSVLTERGYTGHEHLDQIELIHMNARVYDPQTARFLSPDTVLQAPNVAQNHNRYIYVLNNPLKYTDPDGHRYRQKAKNRKSHSQSRVRKNSYAYGTGSRDRHPDTGNNGGNSPAPGNAGNGNGNNGNGNRKPTAKPKPKPKANPSNVAGVGNGGVYSNSDLAKQYGFYGLGRLNGGHRDPETSALDIHVSVEIPFLGGLEAGLVTFAHPADIGLFATASKEIGGIATGRLAIGISVTEGHRSNFDGVGTVVTAGFGKYGGSYGLPLESQNNFPPSSLSVDIGPQIGGSVNQTITGSLTLRDLGRMFLWSIGQNDGENIIGEPN